MKILFLLSTLILSFSICKAADKEPVLKIIYTNGFITKVVIDETEIPVNREKVFLADSLRTGFHKITVYALSEKSGTSKEKIIYQKNIGLQKGFNTLILINNETSGKVKTSPIAGYEFNELVEGGTYDDTRSQPINGRAFANLKTGVLETLDQQKKGLMVKSAIENNFFLTSQEIPLLQLVEPVYWLELAEMFYIVTLDRENFGDVINLFISDADKRKLKEFIENY